MLFQNSNYTILVLLMMLIGEITMAQEVDDEFSSGYINNQEEIKTLSNGNAHFGAYGALTFKASTLKDQTIAMMGIKAAWVVNRSVAIGFEGQGIIPATKFDGITIDPNDKAIILGGYGGLYIEPIIFSNQLVHVTFPLSSGAGWLGYHEDWEERYGRNNYVTGIIDEDVFWYIEPGIGVELNVTRSFRMNFGVTKRFTHDLELIETTSKDFDNLSYFFSLKIGKF